MSLRAADYVTHPRRRPYDSPIGRLLLVADDQGLTHILLANRRLDEIGLDPKAVPEVDDDPVLEATAQQLDEYFAGERTDFDIPLHVEGYEFDVDVWFAMTSIPYGETISYGEQSEMAGHAGAFQAVGSANGRNPIPIVIPCHRVIGSDGSLVGYGGGLAVKRRLLDLEAGVQRLFD